AKKRLARAEAEAPSPAPNQGPPTIDARVLGLAVPASEPGRPRPAPSPHAYPSEQACTYTYHGPKTRPASPATRAGSAERSVILPAAVIDSTGEQRPSYTTFCI